MRFTLIDKTKRKQSNQNKDPSDPRYLKLNLSSKHTQWFFRVYIHCYKLSRLWDSAIRYMTYKIPQCLSHLLLHTYHSRVTNLTMILGPAWLIHSSTQFRQVNTQLYPNKNHTTWYFSKISTVILPVVFSLVLSMILSMTHPGIFRAREQKNKKYY